MRDLWIDLMLIFCTAFVFITGVVLLIKWVAILTTFLFGS